MGRDFDLTAASPARVTFHRSPADFAPRRGLTTERTCGPCTLCCKLLGVPEVPTAVNEWCPHAHKGQGCAIYADRPEPCRTYVCAWLMGELPVWARPDKIHGVVNGVATKDAEIIQIIEDPGWPHAASDALEPLFAKVYEVGVYVTIRCGTDVRVRGIKSALAKVHRVEVTA